MKRLLIGVQLVGTLLTLGVVTFLFANAAKADSESLWVNAGSVTKSTVASNVQYGDKNYDVSCTQRSEDRLSYTYLGGIWVQSGRQPISNYCWQDTEFGVYANGNLGHMIRLGDTGAVTMLDYPSLVLPAGDKLALKYNNGSSFFMGLSVLDTPEAQLKLVRATQVGGTYDKYQFDTSAKPSWRLDNPSNGTALSINATGTSNNGNWMAIETAQSFIRLNVDTKQILAFERPLYGYGSGLNPNYQLAISDDGRYVVISGGNANGSQVNVYDLSTCQPNANPMEAASGCGKRDIRAVAFPGAPATAKFANMRFNSSGDTLNFLIFENNQLNRYLITAPGRDQFGMDYLALGDSFSSGEGDGDGARYYLPGTDRDGEQLFNTGLNGFPYSKEVCHTSSRSYPYLLQEIDVVAKSIACSGANTNDVVNTKTATAADSAAYFGSFAQLRNPQYTETQIQQVKINAINNFIVGREAQLKFVEKYKPRAVTVGIGGNDMNFKTKLEECIQSIETCKYAAGERYTTANEIQKTVYANLTSTYRALKDASNTTRFYAVGYPQIFAENADSCGINVRLDNNEIQYANETIKYLNSIVRAAAGNAGIYYLDIENSLSGKELCSDEAEPAVNGVTKGNDISLPFFNVKVIGNETYHPNEKAHALIASSIRQQLNNESITTHDPCLPQVTPQCPAPSGVPAWPAYFMISAPNNIGFIKYTQFTVDTILDPIQAGATQIVSMSKRFTLTPNSIVKLVLKSDPVELGTFTTDASGTLATNVTIPADAPAGYHTLHLVGTTPSGEPIDLYQPLQVYSDPNDTDGDGVSNASDPCGFVQPAGVDIDRDGIDDACDGRITPDITAPVVTGHVTATPSQNGWFKQDVMISWTAEDDRGGTLTVPSQTAASQEGENEYTSPEVCDTAGNCATGKYTVKIDKTAPQIGSLIWTKNPKAVLESTSVRSSVADALSGIGEAEYFIATDPGAGNGATMQVSGNDASVGFGTDFVTGVYMMGFRVKDQAGNWSQPVSDYLVIYDPNSGVQMRGMRTVVPNLLDGDAMPGLVASSQTETARFAYSISYKGGSINPTSDYQIRYVTGTQCRNGSGQNCHTFDLNSTGFSWFLIYGTNREKGMFAGNGTLSVDGAERRVSFVVSGIDGERSGASGQDAFELRVYPEGSTSGETLYRINMKLIGRGNIKIRE
jgi:hypothetical protein